MMTDRLLFRAAAALLAALLLPACETDCEELEGPMGPGPGAGASETVASGPATWTRYALDLGACGAAWTTVTDIDADGREDIVLSRLGERVGATFPAGEVTLYTRDGDDLGAWSRTPVLPHADDVLFPAGAEPADLDGDGDLDLVVPTGFFICGVVPGTSPCGGLLWFEQTEGGWTRHEIVPPEQEEFFHAALLTDLDGDGHDDLVSVAERWGDDDEPGFAEARFWPGTGSKPPFGEARVIGSGLGSLPKLFDVDGDGDQDLIGAQFFLKGGSFGWFEQVRAPAGDAGEWRYHLIDDSVGGAIDLHVVPDLFGDGRPQVVATNHTNPQEDEGAPESAVLLYEVPADPRGAWTRRTLSEGIVSETGTGVYAPGIVGPGDIDNDGDIDLLVSGDGDPRVFWFEQTAPGAFTQHVLFEELRQAGGLTVADLDGDGDNEFLVTGYEANALYLFD